MCRCYNARSVSGAPYARLLPATDVLYAPPRITREIAFDAFGTLVHTGCKRHPFERLTRQARNQAWPLPSPMIQPIDFADYAPVGLPYLDAELTLLNEELATIEPNSDTLGALRRIGE